MFQVRIVRQDADEDGTFGSMCVGGELTCFTLEPYHRDNAQNVSCIPTGQYICKRYSSSKYPDTWEVTGVHGRTKILFHTGNVEQDTQGCIILGRRKGMLRTQEAVLESRLAFDEFRSMLGSTEQFKLSIVDCF